MMNVKKRILIVGGTFDEAGGRPSGLVEILSNWFKVCEDEYNYEVFSFNGGYYHDLAKIQKGLLTIADIVLWWPNVPNELPKLRDIKEINYKVISVMSKRNDDNKYTYQDIMQRMFEQKANLNVIFERLSENKFKFTLIDPLGNLFYTGTSIKSLAEVIIKRGLFLTEITRASTTSDEENRGALAWYFNMFKEEMIHDDSHYEVPEKKYFLEVIKNYAEIFARTISGRTEAVRIKRFLGNASFRCPKGFPSFREGKYIFVSRRNVDKTHITIEEFVPTYLKDNQVYYLGDNKPSVDSPVQLRLYQKLPNIKYMLHAHVYVKDAPFTKEVLPCGALEETNEILDVINTSSEGLNTKFAVINLKGHGCLIMSDDVEKIENLKDKIIARPRPELISIA